MQTLNNSKQIGEIVRLLPNIKDKIEKTTNEMNNYLESIKDEKYEEKENEREEDAIKRAESIYDRLGEMVERRKIVMQNGKETIDLIDNVKLRIEEVVKSCENDKIHLDNANDELIEKIIDLEDRKRIRDIKPFQDKIDEINKIFNSKKNEWECNLVRKKKEEEMRQQKEETRTKRKEVRKEEEIKKITNSIIDSEEMKQIEEWTRMKIGNIIFDSDVDNWKEETSVFDQKVKNKSNLIFIIEDVDSNKFGGYVNAKIDKSYVQNNETWIKDSNAFLFSFKSNGRINGMMKFDIKESQHAFWLWSQSYDGLFYFVNDIRIFKENKKAQSNCKQSAFNYNGIQNALCGKEIFTPKRISVIQLM